MEEPVELPGRLAHRINLSSILGNIAFFSLIGATGTVEESPLLTAILIAVFGICANLAMKEDGQRK